MKKFIKALLLPPAMMIASCTGNVQPQEEGFNYIDERFADIQMLRYNVDGFDSLTLKQKTLILPRENSIGKVIFQLLNNLPISLISRA